MGKKSLVDRKKIIVEFFEGETPKDIDLMTSKIFTEMEKVVLKMAMESKMDGGFLDGKELLARMADKYPPNIRSDLIITLIELLTEGYA